MAGPVKMERKNNFTPDEDRDETLVTPRFDRGEAETAQPVVPLAVVSGEAETYDLPAVHSAPRVMPLRSWALALILVSALAGGVLGGAGLYVFQKSRQDGAAAAPVEQTPAAAEQASAPAVETTPEPSPTPAEEAAALPVELTEQVAELPVADEEAEDRTDADTKREESKREEAAAPAPRERSSPAEAPVKRGKKGDRDEVDNRGRESRPRRVADEYPREAPSDDDDEDYNDRREARRVGSIVYGGEGRRERRRQRRQAGVDRVRGIFEGQP